MNPWEYQFVNTFFSGALETGLDSVKPNLQLITRLSDVGLVGIGAMVAVFAALYHYGKARTPIALRKEYLLSFAALIALLQVVSAGDLLVFLAVGTAVQVYAELGIPDQAKKQRPVTLQSKSPELPPSPLPGTA